MERLILHVDANHFYANVEKSNHPELKGIPLVVGGDVEQRHGIILAKSDEAKRCGVKTGEALWQAKEKCPELKIVPPNFPLYLRYNKLMKKMYEEYSDRVEFFGLDEAWIDVSGSLKYFNQSGRQIAEEIRKRIKQELGITVTVGISWNKIFAKLGSDGPSDSVVEYTKSNYKKEVWKLPADALLGVGYATMKKLYRKGFRTIGDIANASPTYLQSFLHKWGLFLHIFANGMDTSPVARTDSSSVIKSIGNSTTTPRDLLNEEDVRITYMALCESVAARLREHGLMCRTVQIHLRDNALFSFERQVTLKKPTCLATELLDAAMGLLRQSYSWLRPLRSIGVRAANLVAEHTDIQLDLFCNEARRQKEETIERTIDMIRRRYGHYAIIRAAQSTDKDLGHINPKDDHIIHPVGFF